MKVKKKDKSWGEEYQWRDINAAVLLLWMGWSTLGGEVGAMWLVSVTMGSFVKGVNLNLVIQ